jgi:DNA-binding SARP family transcriptional activator/tetratricopeptide (TPR) repeat protein
LGRRANPALTVGLFDRLGQCYKSHIPVEFRVLGPLGVVEDGRPVPLDRRRMRALLAFLLLHANELVSSDRLIDEVWGPDPPKTAGASLQNYISRLRKAIGPELIVSQAPGYVLRVDPERFDLARFERLTAEARGAEPRERAEKLRAALALWRGPALEDLAFEPFARDEVGRLEEARLAALEERIDADLEIGRDGELVGELEQLVEEHPLRERFRGQLMRALYRAGRQADALAAFQTARQVLLDELGLEPSGELRNLQQAILQQDPSLGARAAVVVERGADRRRVSVLFCDLVGSGELAAQLDPEAYRTLLSRYFDAVRAPIERHGGTIEKFIGDAVFAVFGVPELHEDDALRAVRAAIEARDALRAQEIAARIGVSTGEVHVLSAPGEDLHVSGAAASVASQLEGRAPAGGILISEETHTLVRDALRAENVDGAWLVHELVPGAPAYARRLDAPLVGRTDELARLHSAYVDARDSRRARVVTVVGEAGIGKTRLMRELLARMGDEARVLVGRCVSYGEGATYLPIAEMVRQAAREPSLAGIRELLDGEEDAGQVAQRIAELIGISEGPAAPGEVFWAVRRFAEAVARRQPTVLVLDDIHWAEPTLLDLVEYLGEWIEAPVFILCAARAEMLDERPAWGGPTSTGFLVELVPLEPPDVATLVVGLAEEPLDPELEERIVEQAGGNPLYAEQLVALSREAPDLSLDDTPPTVEALIASRLDRLDPRELAVLRRASVVGRLFTREELDDMTPAADAGRTERHLVDLTQRGLVHPGADRFRFHHALVRDVAYRGIPKADRADLHEQAAHGLDRRDAADEVVGYHFEHAHHYLVELTPGDERARELASAGGERLGRAGIRAWKRADAPAAANLLTRAVDLTPWATGLLCELALALNARGQRDRAQEVLATVADDADETNVLRARIESEFLRSLSEPERAGKLLEIASAAVPVLEAGSDDRALGRAYVAIAHVRGGFYCEYAEMQKASERALACYRREGWSSSTALDFLGSALCWGPTPVEDAIARCEGLLDVHRGDKASEANLFVWLGTLEAMRGRWEAGRARVELARTSYRDLGLTDAEIDTCARALGFLEQLAGRLDEAEAAYRAGCVYLQERHLTAVLATRAAELAGVLYEQKRYDEAAERVAQASELAGTDDLDATLVRLPVEARVAARQGALDEAHRIARNAVEVASETDALGRRAEALTALADVEELAGRDSDARSPLAEALALHEQKGNLPAAERLRARLPGGAATRR